MRSLLAFTALVTLLVSACDAFVVPRRSCSINRSASSLCLAKAEEPGPLYQLLATSRESDSKPGNCNFFYNDEVSSHLHGYMLLFGLFAAKDEVFLLSFGLFAAISAGGATVGLLPANPRVPALVAIATLATTLFIRNSLGFNPEMLGYEADTSWKFELLVCAVNVIWGLGGSWRTKEQKNGATFGF